MGWFNTMLHHLPLATGPYMPGMIDVMLDYKKESPFIRLYYPTDEKFDLNEQSKRWITWMPDNSYLEGISKVLMLYKLFLKIAFWWSDNIKIPALYGAKPRTTEPIRCIVMSHGLGGCRFLYSNICCELASKGFLVAALEHRDQSACNTYYYASKSDAESDKRTMIEFKHVKLGKDHYTRRNEQLKIKSGECSKVVDFLVNLQKGIVPYNVLADIPLHKKMDMEFKLDSLVGNLDVDNMCMMGHSFGAATALYTLSTRPEFKTGILLDPWMFPVKNEGLEGNILKPLLFINTQTFHIAANVEAMSKLMHVGGTKMYTIRHTTHENQTDSVLLIGYWLNWFMKKLDPLLALRINNSLILKFLHEQINYPADVTNCVTFLEREQKNIEEGLTKPWA